MEDLEIIHNLESQVILKNGYQIKLSTVFWVERNKYFFCDLQLAINSSIYTDSEEIDFWDNEQFTVKFIQALRNNSPELSQIIYENDLKDLDDMTIPKQVFLDSKDEILTCFDNHQILVEQLKKINEK